MKKRNWLLLCSVILFLNVLIFFSSCATSNGTDEGSPQYELNVTVGEGVTGTPVSGTYTYEKGDMVDYSYSLLPTYKSLATTLDGETIEPTGTITISGIHNLKATAVQIRDITGAWSLQEEYDDGSSFSVNIIFTGTLDNGTVTDSDGGSGTYTVENNNIITFNLVFPAVTYEYKGNFDDADNISGTSERKIGSETYLGSWSAIRDSQLTQKYTSTGKKGHSD